MATSDQKPGPQTVQTLAEGALHLERPSVDLTGLPAQVFQFLVQVGMIHKLLFGTPLVVSGGSEDEPTERNTKPNRHMAEILLLDLKEDERIVFVSVFTWAAWQQQMQVHNYAMDPVRPVLLFTYCGE